jgi:hypothetical protein
MQPVIKLGRQGGQVGGSTLRTGGTTSVPRPPPRLLSATCRRQSPRTPKSGFAPDSPQEVDCGSRFDRYSQGVSAGVGLEPTTYGLTVPRKSSGAVHVRPPCPDMAVRLPSSSTVVHRRPLARLSHRLSDRQSPVATLAMQTWRLRLDVLTPGSLRLHGWVPELASFPPEIAIGATWLPSGHMV